VSCLKKSRPAALQSSADTLGTGAVQLRIITLMRLVLAASALLIILIDPSEPDRLIALTFATLGLYTLYSVALYLLALFWRAHLEPLHRWAHWIDVCWFVALIALSRGTSSIFFFGFFFAILVASFSWGFAEGLKVTIASAVLFTVVGYATAPSGPEFELNRFLLRPIYMCVLGYMMAFWGGREIRLRRRLALLKEMTASANPRFGVDRTTGLLMELLRTFYGANACLSITVPPGMGEQRMRRATSDDPEGAARVKSIPAELAAQLLAPPAEAAILYRGQAPGWLRSSGGYYGYDLRSGTRVIGDQRASRELAATIDAESFVSIPLYFNHSPFGRLYVTAAHPRAFDEADIDFLLQVDAHVTPILDNIRLIDRLALDAADEERRRIARDIHDSVIQPYIGLQMGLAAIRRKQAAGQDAASEVERLYNLTSEGINELRGYVHNLRTGGDSANGLVASVRRFASKLAATTGIDVQIEAADSLPVNDRLAADVFQMVVEGLSNIRRHTQATRATVYLARRPNHLAVCIENERPDGVDATPFTPRSISERARALGGSAHVEHPPGSTAIQIEIPL
jgi:signal transduction histidine kinase